MKKNILNLCLGLAALSVAGLGCNRFGIGGSKPNIDVAVSPSNQKPGDSTEIKPAAYTTSKAKVWELGNKLSLAAVLFEAQGITHAESITVAKDLATEIGAEVPSFPAKTGNNASDGAAILHYLLTGPGKTIGEKIGSKYDRDHTDLYEISLKSNVLLMMYGPGDSLGKTTAKFITKAGERAKLPKPCWGPLVAKIEGERPYDDVKEEIFDMQKNVGGFLNVVTVSDPTEPAPESGPCRNSPQFPGPENELPKYDEPPPVPKPASSPPPKTVSGGVLNGKAINLVTPAYPPAAKAVRASGVVNVQVTIDEAGSVISASAVSGHPLLRAAAASAARGSRFSPTMLSGQPVKVTGVVTFNFVLP